MGPAEGAVVIKRWMTGAEVREEYGLKLFELSELLERGLPAYEPETGNRYISPEGCKKTGAVFSMAELREKYEPAIKKFFEAACEGAGVSAQRFAELYPRQLEKDLEKIAEGPHPPEGHAILNYRVHPRATEYPTWLAAITGALFRPADVEVSLAAYQGHTSPSERIAELERQLAETRQERDALAAEMVKLRDEAGEAEKFAAVNPKQLSDKQAEALRVLLMRHEGKTVVEVGEALFPEVYAPRAQEQRVFRAQRLAWSMLSGGDKSAP